MQAATVGNTAARQPMRSTSMVASGRKASWPVAELAVSTPSTRPRCLTNHRFATVAPSTIAVRPVPRPTTTPHSTMRCQKVVITVASSRPAEIIATAVTITARRPKRSMKAAEKGAIRPKSMMRRASADEIAAVDQPYSSWSGRISAPGRPMAPAVVSMVRNVSATTTQA